MLADAAQPTRQSNQSRLRQGYAGQGLSGRVGSGDHSRTAPPGADDLDPLLGAGHVLGDQFVLAHVIPGLP
jgi:hypothetical protein